nr:unnamed protein product [Digitaria exilis]
MEGDLSWCYGSSDDNWDLHAVVRFACGGGGGHVTPPKASDESFSWLPLPQKDEKMNAAWWPPLPADEDLCLFAAPKPDTTQPASPRNEAPPQQPLAKPRRTSYRNGGGPARSKRKKKKIQVSKEVTRVPAGAASPDPWAWRKYGQKPIKGSPHLPLRHHAQQQQDAAAIIHLRWRGGTTAAAGCAKLAIRQQIGDLAAAAAGASRAAPIHPAALFAQGSGTRRRRG